MGETAVAAATGVRDPLSVYRERVAGGHDELLDARGNVRPHWHSFVSTLEEFTEAERSQRAFRLDRRVRETGIAYDMFADPSKTSQRWQLDLVPLIFSPEEWRWLEKALIQRARLFDALLHDLYDSQRTLADGLIPADLIFSDSAFLHPARGILPKTGPLRFYAADLARSPDGTWRIIDSHTETLAGVGFALANRVVHSHVAGDILRRCNAVRAASHFQRLQSALTTHTGRDDPRCALLTPGPHHEDYFSHAYIARYLGYLLVEGNDLRTRAGKLFLKTLEGLKEIDLVVRCIDARYADALEFDTTAFLGPVGLMQAVRKQPRLMVNAVGTAVAQNRGLSAYLPALAERLLGETLMLPDATRWWLGDDSARRHVMANLGNLVIRKAQEGTGRPGRAAFGSDPATLAGEELAQLAREMELHGAEMVAEAKIGFGTTPSLDLSSADGIPLKPSHFAVRLYVAMTLAGYAVMPGGLAMTVDPGSAVALSAPDGQTRDVWVVSDAEQAPHVSLWRPTVENARVQRSQRVIQSRVADDLFWLGRYAERADWTLRIVRSALQRVEEDSGPATGRRAVKRCIEDFLGTDAGPPPARAGMTIEAEIEFLCRRIMAVPCGGRMLAVTFDGVYRVASLSRDRLSLEAWRTLSPFQPGSALRASLAAARSDTALDLIDEALSALAAFNGLNHENMTRNFGWAFLDMGRRLSRAFNLAEAVFALFATPLTTDEEEEIATQRFLLEAADSFITYRSRYRLDPMLPLVLDLLLLDESNPRSLAFQLAVITRHLEALPKSGNGSMLPEERRQILALQTAVRLFDVQPLGKGDRDELAAITKRMVVDLPELSNTIARRYFSLLQARPHRLTTRHGQKS